MLNSLNRGLNVLEYLMKHKSASVTEIAAEFSVDKGTASRILATLAEHELAYKDVESQKYYISLGPLLSGYHAMNARRIIEIAHPILVELSEKTGESAHFCALQNERLYLVDQVKGRRNRYMKDAATPGMTEPFHCSAVGKVLLAFLPEAEARRLLNDHGMNEYTPNTQIDPERLLEQLPEIREKRYALDNEEFCRNTSCVAVPVYDEYGCVTYAVGISGTDAIINGANLASLLSMLWAAGRNITQKYCERK